VPTAVRLQEELGDQVQILFVEVQGSSPKDIVKKQLQHKWLGGKAMWTSERPFNNGFDGIPNFALLDADGNVVLRGYSNRNHKQIEESIAQMLKASKKGSEDLPKAVGKAMVDIGKGEYAKANSVLAKLIEKPSGPNPEALKAAAESAQSKMMARHESEMKRVKWMLENGYPSDGEELYLSLNKRSKGLVGVQESLNGIGDSLKTSEMKIELTAAKSLAKLEQKFFDDSKGKFQKKFEKLVEKYTGTQVAKRASYWVQYSN
jgi:hypothetical protein